MAGWFSSDLSRENSVADLSTNSSDSSDTESNRSVTQSTGLNGNLFNAMKKDTQRLFRQVDKTVHSVVKGVELKIRDSINDIQDAVNDIQDAFKLK